MEKPFMESLTSQELIRLQEQTIVDGGGDYTAPRRLVEEELQRRTRIMQAMDAVNDAYLVPVDPADLTICESCE